MTQPQVVLVHWIDAWANSAGYYDSSYAYESLPMIDIGYLVKENDAGILTSRCIQFDRKDETYRRHRGESFTPWEMVTKVEILEYD